MIRRRKIVGETKKEEEEDDVYKWSDEWITMYCIYLLTNFYYYGNEDENNYWCNVFKEDEREYNNDTTINKMNE